MQTMDAIGAKDEEALVRSVSSMTFLGGLADDVVLDALRIKSGRKDGADSSAIRAAVDLFSAVQTQPSLMDIWNGNDLALTFARISRLDASHTAGNAPGRGSSTREENALLIELTDGLRAISDGVASAEQFSLIINVFDRVSKATLTAAQDSTDARSTALQWLHH